MRFPIRCACACLLLVAAGCGGEDECGVAGRPIFDEVRRLAELDGVVTVSRSGDEMPWSATPVGDVNGDAVFDLLISPRGGDEFRAYVVFGGASLRAGPLAGLVADGRGFVVHDLPEDIAANPAWAPLGDVNGDGLADLGFGGSREPTREPGGGLIVFGRTADAPVALTTLVADGGGVVIASEADGSGDLGHVMAGAGDVDGDGLGDVFVVASDGEVVANDPYDELLSYDDYTLWLVSGGGARTITLGRGAGARALLRSGAGDDGYPHVVGTGDLDGDGRNDFAIGDPNAAGTRGRVYLVSAAVLELADVPTPTPTPSDAVAAGLAAVVEGAEIGDLLGLGPVDVGDLNGDGRPEVAFGAGKADDARGQVLVVFGGPNVWTTTRARVEAGSGGFVVRGDQAGDEVKYVHGGDFDGDGARDLLLGSDAAERHDGATHLLRGAAGWTGRTLEPGSPGLVTIVGLAGCGPRGNGVVAPGDVNGDGIDDFVLHAHSVVGGTTDPVDARIDIVLGRSRW